MGSVWRWCLLWLALWGSAAAWAQHPAPIRLDDQRPPQRLEGANVLAWFDPTGQRLLEQVENAPGPQWVARRPGQQDRLDDGALWLQFEATIADGSRWYLAIGSSGLDRAQLFYRDPAGLWVLQEAGDSRPVSRWPVPGRVPTFELSHEAGKPVRYWVRVEHARVDFAAPLTLYSQDQLLVVREREQFLLGAYVGLAVLITLVALANAVVHRDRLFATYAAYVAMLTAGQVAYLGIGAQHLWDTWLAWNQLATFLLPGLSSAAALWFVHAVTEPARFSRALDRAVWLLIVAIVVAVLADAAIATRGSYALVLALVVVALVMVGVLIVLVWTRGDDPTIRLVALGFLPVIVMALFPLARGFNLIPNSALTRYGLSIGAAIEMPILFYALSLRGSRRREAQARASALPHTDALTGLADHRSLLQRLESALARARQQKRPCALLAVRIANFEPIAAEYGREMAERLLVVAGSHVRQAATDIDLAARAGEREFALLVEGPTTTDEAAARAQQIVASGLRPAAALPGGVLLKFQVAVAMLPDQYDAGGSLHWLLSALAAMRPDSRKQIRALNF